MLTPFLNKPDSLRDLTILMISLICSFEIISVAIPRPNVFLLTSASAADAAAVNPNRIKKLLANGLGTYPIKVF